MRRFLAQSGIVSLCTCAFKGGSSVMLLWWQQKAIDEGSIYNTLLKSANVPVHWIWRKRFHSVLPKTLWQILPVHITQVTTDFYTQLCVLISVHLLVQKVIIKWWLNWPQISWMTSSSPKFSVRDCTVWTLYFIIIKIDLT